MVTIWDNPGSHGSKCRWLEVTQVAGVTAARHVQVKDTADLGVVVDGREMAEREVVWRGERKVFWRGGREVFWRATVGSGAEGGSRGGLMARRLL